MAEEIVNPFKQTKKVDWAKKNKERLVEAKNKSADVQTDVDRANNKSNFVKQPLIETNKSSTKKIAKKEEKYELKKNDNGTPIRVAKSFKIYPGKISREFDKRVNKLQVSFDDLNYEKNFVDSGKYMMFLMSFAEKFNLYELYKTTDHMGNFEIDKQEILNHFGAIFKKF